MLVGVAIQVQLAAQPIVTTPVDSGPGSLRKAIADAVSDDSITFANTLSRQTIILTSGQITVNKNLTIDGNGSGRVLEFLPSTINTLTGLAASSGAGAPGFLR